MRLRAVSFSSEFADQPDLLEQIIAAIKWPLTDAKASAGGLAYWNTFLVDIDVLPLGVPYMVSDKQPSFLHPEIAGLATRDSVVINQRVNVAVPGIGLLMMNNVKVLADLCTEALQEELDEGWRILAICPQPDQRRPDYVLGRVQKDEDV